MSTLRRRTNAILSDLVVFMKYAQRKEGEQRRENWSEIVARNIKMHCERAPPSLHPHIHQAYTLVYDKKVLPSMRSLQFGGLGIRKNNARMYNCAFVPVDTFDSIGESFFLLLGGTGVGFSVQQHHVARLPLLRTPTSHTTHVVRDSAAGWAHAVVVLLENFARAQHTQFDFGLVRARGSPLQSYGLAAGADTLRQSLEHVRTICLDAIQHRAGRLSTIDVHDMVCHLANNLTNSGSRRSALISLFSHDDVHMRFAKSGEWWREHGQRARANNSIVLLRDTITRDFFVNTLWPAVRDSGSGEPGIFFTNSLESGTNPCAEIALNAHQFCNLCEINVSNLQSELDLFERAHAAALIGTLQATYTNFKYLRAEWRRETERERLLGIGLTGLAAIRDLAHVDWTHAATVASRANHFYAAQLGIEPAARLTTIKPSGTTSLVCGTSSGIHAYHAPFYVRRVRMSQDEPIYAYLRRKLGAHTPLLEKDLFEEDGQVLCVPMAAPEGAIVRNHESALDMLARVKHMAHAWIEPGHRAGHNKNNVSATVSIRPHEWDEVRDWMWSNRHVYNGLSILPYVEHTYQQAPFEECDEQRFETLARQLIDAKLNFDEVSVHTNSHMSGELACAGGACEL